jgi:uncharacterized membrane protein YfcA
MLTPLLTVFVGLVLGFLAGLGIGGGSLLILWLTLCVGTEPITARAINLMFFLTAAGSVSIFRLKNGDLQFKSILPAVVSGCIAAAIGSWFGTWIDQSVLKKIFGGLLLITGLREMFYRPRKAK